MNLCPRFVAVAALCGLLPFAATANEPNLSKKRVVQLADAAAKNGGYDLRHYERSKPRFGVYDRKPSWMLIYDAKPGDAAIGNHFFVHVSDQDGSTKVSPGH